MTDRLTVDSITSDQLDALYERVAKAEHEAEVSVAAAAQLTTLVGKRSEKAEKAAKAQRQRAKNAETELRVLRTGLRANGADPTQIQNLWAQIRLRNRQWRDEKRRAERAEAAIERVRALHQPQPDGTAFLDGQQCKTCSQDGGDGYQYLVPWPCPTAQAIAPPADQTTER
ncbi:hypothetical protein ACFFKE_32280 [Streptomyces mutabilis]|uniref:hypothetical protein n=1 Tax=Streptomyces mutabilis TaxID=67332 RepID=UPI00177F6E66|nr:hypothetical protein [Streptomyces mutabilis]GGQ38419.1 hypothetical protein GCM10010279_54640 [Streptomyces mutabilis]